MTPAKAAARLIVILVALLLPTASLAVLGGFYLWEKGWMLWWAAGALASVACAVLVVRWLLPPPASAAASPSAPLRTARAAEALSPAEMRAWNDVRAIAAGAELEALTTLPKAVELGQRTIEAVAARLHPEKPDAIWQFTLPEAFAIIERVSDRLGYLTEARIPFGDRLTVAQVLAIYRWRGMVDVATRAYDIWRLVRMANPATAATQEARERLSHAMLVWGRDHLARRLVEAYVEEVGRAAIDLYGGRLASAAARRKADVAQTGEAERQGSSTTARPAAASSPTSRRSAERTSLVILGSSTDRTSVAQAIIRAALDPDGRQRLNISNSNAITPARAGRRQLLRDLRRADVAIWTFDHIAGPHPADLAALEVLRRHYGREIHHVPPALIVLAVGASAVSDAELVRRAGALASGLTVDPESIPENADVQQSDARTIDGDASLVLAFAATDPDQTRDAERVVAIIESLAPALARARALRALDRSRGQGGWVGAGRQAISAAGALTSAVIKRGNRT